MFPRGSCYFILQGVLPLRDPGSGGGQEVLAWCGVELAQEPNSGYVAEAPKGHIKELGLCREESVEGMKH